MSGKHHQSFGSIEHIQYLEPSTDYQEDDVIEWNHYDEELAGSSFSTDATDLPAWDGEDFLSWPRSMKRSGTPAVAHAVAIAVDRYMKCSSKSSEDFQVAEPVISAEFFHEETKNFWKPNRGVHITMLKHSSCHCLELIATDAANRQLEASNEHIFVDLIKLTQKCSSMLQDTTEYEGQLMGVNRPRLRKRMSPPTMFSSENQELMLKKAMVKYLMDRIVVETFDPSHLHHSSSTVHNGSNFRVALRPMLDDDVRMVDGMAQVDVVCPKPASLQALGDEEMDDNNTTFTHDWDCDGEREDGNQDEEELEEEAIEVCRGRMNRQESSSTVDCYSEDHDDQVMLSRNISMSEKLGIPYYPSTGSGRKDRDRDSGSDEDEKLKQWEKNFENLRVGDRRERNQRHHSFNTGSSTAALAISRCPGLAPLPMTMHYQHDPVFFQLSTSSLALAPPTRDLSGKKTTPVTTSGHSSGTQSPRWFDNMSSSTTLAPSCAPPKGIACSNSSIKLPPLLPPIRASTGRQKVK